VPLTFFQTVLTIFFHLVLMSLYRANMVWSNCIAFLTSKLPMPMKWWSAGQKADCSLCNPIHRRQQRHVGAICQGCSKNCVGLRGSSTGVTTASANLLQWTTKCFEGVVCSLHNGGTSLTSVSHAYPKLADWPMLGMCFVTFVQQGE
jgi:hypothetical protein